MVEIILVVGLAISLVVDLVLNKREYRRRGQMFDAIESQLEKTDRQFTSSAKIRDAQLDDQLMKYSDFLEEQRRKSAELFEQSVKRIDDSLLENSSQVENVLSGFVDKLEEKDRKTISFILDVADFMEEVEDLAETAEQIAQLQVFTNQPALQELKAQTVYLAKRAKAMRKEIESTGVANEE